ncbi:MAG: RecQ family ATP-dependent DNA helicase, partial [Lactobacillaceae bacterium]|nr:RecQ family ATP-dependent DNA helicase [Lactobacillaceae bacterium]
METPNTLLEKIYGYSAFREGQLDIINSVLAGQKTLGIMPTGGGKSITYQISGLLLPGITLVISPLISLIQNQVDELISARVTATELTSALSPEEQEKRKQEIYRGLYKFVFIAPERLENEYFYSFLSQLNLSLVVIDEAHSLSQWGHDFRPAYLNSVNYIQNLPQHPRVLALTATATKRVEEEIVDLLEIQKVVKTSPYRPNLVLKMEHGLSKKQKLDFILRYVKAHANEVGIIYASKRAEVEEITEFLVANNINARRYHAGLSDQERTEAQHAFLYDEADVIVATVAFGMGINKSNVRYVIHNNMPGTIEAYYQEIGRAGRDGLDSEVTLLYSTSDADTQRFFIDHSENQSPEFRDVQLNKLQEMIRYGSTQMCLQRYIMRYFGEDIENCGRCTNCLDARPAVDETKLAESIIGAVLEVTELGRTASKTTLIDILRGTLNENMSWTNFT